MKWLIPPAVLVVLACLLSVRFLTGRARAAAANAALSRMHLELPEVASLEILPVVEYEAVREDLKAEAGVSYLIKADDETILFDLGYNQRREEPSPLVANLRTLGIDSRGIQAVAISHPHVDHAGGLEIIKAKRAWSTGFHTDLGVAKGYAPSAMEIDGRPAVVLAGPAMIGKNIGSTGPLAAQLFLPGRLHEQSLLIRVKNKGLVLITGCGHPGIVRIVRAAKRQTGLPVYAVCGGFHLYYTKCNGGPMPMIVGADRLFCLRPTRAMVEKAVADLRDLGVERVYLSPHDADEPTMQLFAQAYGERCERLQAGKAVRF